MNLGNLTSWNPLGHSRPVTELLYLYYFDYSKMTYYIFVIRPTFSCVALLKEKTKF